MKNLKKLSVAFMLLTIITTSFTSCIDNEVSPIVEEIYENQADLLAAQAGVLDAEAILLTAEAEYQLGLAAYQQALAEGEVADATYRLEQVETLIISNAEAQLDLEESQAKLNIKLAELINELNEVGAIQAVSHALSYRTYINVADGLLNSKYDAEVNLAEAQYEVDFGLYSDFAKTALEADVKQAALQVEWQQVYVDELLALIADPNSLAAQVTAWEAREDELNAMADLLDAKDEVLQETMQNLIDGWDGEDDIRDDFINEYERQVADSLSWSNLIKVQQDIIDAALLAVGTYDADLLAAEGDVTAAETAAETAETALGMEDANENAVVHANYYTVDADGDAIAIGGVKYTTPANLQEVLVNAQIDLADATDAHSTYETDLAALTASYNEAATALEAAQAAFDGNTYASDLADAQSDLTDAQTSYGVAEQAYTDAQVAFAAAPTGSVTADGVDVHANGQISYDDIDLGETGIHSDLAGDTYMRVNTWKETTIGSGLYVPASFYPTKYNASDLAVHITTIKADAVNAENVNITVDGDIWVWEATGAGAMVMNNGAGALVTADDHALTAGEAIDADNDDRAVFVNVELDDSSISNLFTFNVATNELGKDDFSGRVLNIDAPNYASPNHLVLVDTNASYDNTPDSDGESTGNMDELTAEAVLWNAKLDVAIAQDAFDTGDDALVAAQDAFAYQKELFEIGVAELAILKTAKTNATTADTDAKKDVDDAWVALGATFTTGVAGNALKVKATVAPTNSLNLNEVLFNAEVTLADLELCDEACLTASIPAAEHAIGLIQPKLDVALAIIADMQAQYDIYMVTFINGGLDADLQAEYNTLAHERFLLGAEIDAIDAELDYLDEVLDDIDNNDNLNDLRWDVEQFYTNSGAGSFADSMEDLATAEEALATFNAEAQNSDVYLAYLQALIDTLDQRYNNALDLAAEQLRLMNLALGN